MLEVKELAKMIDHTYLKADATNEHMRKLCAEAKEYGFAMVAINSYQTAYCKELLKGTDVHVGAAISFPLGQTTIEVKAFETEDAIKNGADEIDYVVNLNKVKEHDWIYLEKEMRTIVDICKKNNVISKVIFENCYLEDDEKIELCKMANKVGIDFVKTSTGFGTGGATLDDVKLMRENTNSNIRVKAAGGIRTCKDALEFVKLGATRLGTSAGPKIIEEYKELLKEGSK